MTTAIPLDAWLGAPKGAHPWGGILTRPSDEPRSLRFGWPADEAGLLRLDQALAGIRWMGMS